MSMKNGHAQVLEALANDLRRSWGSSSEDLRAEIEAWLGARLKEMGRPKRFLDRIGDKAAEWESRVSPKSRAALWNERSNALRLIGRGRDALEISKTIPSMLTGLDDRPDQRVQIRNLAILQREFR